MGKRCQFPCLVENWIIYELMYWARQSLFDNHHHHHHHHHHYHLDHDVFSTFHSRRPTDRSMGLLNCASTIPRILPIFSYMARRLEPWKMIDVLDNWCLRRILNIHAPNLEARLRTQQPPLSDVLDTSWTSPFLWTCLQNRLRQGPSSCFKSQHVWPAKRLGEETWPSKTDVATYRWKRRLIV